MVIDSNVKLGALAGIMFLLGGLFQILVFPC